MLKKRQYAYLLSWLLFTVAAILLALDHDRFWLVFAAALITSYLWEPNPRRKPFWSGSRVEWMQVGFITAVLVGYALFLFLYDPGYSDPVGPSPFDSQVFRVSMAALFWVLFTFVHLHRFRNEKRGLTNRWTEQIPLMD